MMVGFGDIDGTAAAISELVLDDHARAELAGSAYRLGWSMTWDQMIH